MAKRRAVLERIAGGAGVAVAAGLAGCGSASDQTNLENASGVQNGSNGGSGSGGDGAGESGGGSGDGSGGPSSGAESPTASGPTVKGTVKGKHVVGADGDQPIVRMNETVITASDSAYDDRFSRGNFTVGEGVAEEMASAHGDLSYYVVLRLTTDDPSIDASKGDRVTYATTREWFNAVRLGELVWAKTAGGEQPRIAEFIGQ